MLGILTAFYRGQQRTQFTEIDVERINVVESDGKLRMVISNQARQHPGIVNGKVIPRSGPRPPGMIFFNDEGTENGGLTFTGRELSDGRYTSSVGMSFDQFNQDEVLTLRYSDNNGRRSTGITIADRAPVDIYDMIQERDSINRMPDGPEKTAARERWAAPRNGVPLRATRAYLGRDQSKSSLLILADPMGRPRIQLKQQVVLRHELAVREVDLVNVPPHPRPHFHGGRRVGPAVVLVVVDQRSLLRMLHGDLGWLRRRCGLFRSAAAR